MPIRFHVNRPSEEARAVADNMLSQVESQRVNFQSLDMEFLGSLLPGIIHNLSTPLSGVLGATQLLEMRADSISNIIKYKDVISEDAREELLRQLEKNSSNIQIVARNARYLSEILRILVHRINRYNRIVRESVDINELLRIELRFLEADLAFKHKVRKALDVDENMPQVQITYAHLASAIDEFVGHVLSAHDIKRGLIDMKFATAAAPDEVSITVTACFIPRTQPIGKTSALDLYLTRAEEDGWHTQVEYVENNAILTMTRPL